MNHFHARQRSDNGKWYWVRYHAGKFYATEPCWQGCAHDTQEDAEYHYYDWQISNLLVHTIDDETQKKCEFPGCSRWTQRYLEPPKPKCDRLAFLCDDHRDAWGYRAVRPFNPPYDIWTTW